MLLNCDAEEESRESLGLQGVPTSPSYRKSVLNIHWKDWSWSWNSNPLATLCEELTHMKRPWCWERLKVEGEGDDRRWDDWMASRTQSTWVWVNSRDWWWTGRPGLLQSMRLHRVRLDWATELNWRFSNQFIFLLLYWVIWALYILGINTIILSCKYFLSFSKQSCFIDFLFVCLFVLLYKRI